MPIEFNCSKCNKLLRTPDDSAGKKGRCPDCGTVMVIPGQSTAKPSGGPAHQPIAKDPFSGLPPTPAADPLGLGGTDPLGMGGGGPAAAKSSPYSSPAANSHQGPKGIPGGYGGQGSTKVGLVMGLGITSLCFGLLSLPGVCCCLLGIPTSVIAIGCGLPAWIVGQSELKKYNTGQLSGKGKGEIQAGWICGIVGVCLGLLYFVIFLIGLIFNFTMTGMSMMNDF